VLREGLGVAAVVATVVMDKLECFVVNIDFILCYETILLLFFEMMTAEKCEKTKTDKDF
jgi:hypothetical protein